MRRAIAVKHWFFRHFAFVASIFTAPAIGVAVHYRDQVQWQFLLTGTTIWLSLIYFVLKQRLAELHLFKELFEEFNSRYDALNELLARIAVLPSNAALSADDKAVLVDYFNLCGEEYLYYRQGYIFPEVWQAWISGMRYYYCHPLIRAFWDGELKGNSYYGLAKHHLMPEDECREDKGPATLTGDDSDIGAGVPALDSVKAVATGAQAMPGEE